VTEMPVDPRILEEIALSPREYELIVRRLGREPEPLELGMFGGLWSEHCGYKHSKLLLRRLPSRGRGVLVRPGEENAGAVDIGDGLAAVLKMESHNHPSAVEPFQGAATGVGGIVRDIFTMGARPIALMNSLRFGPPDRPRDRYLFSGVVSGIAWYGNCLGIPNVGGEAFFSPAYSSNPLVNVLCLGLAPVERLVRARASGEGNLLVLIGAETGRDGLHGASGLASRTFEGERELRSAVQVGNPFLEKVLLEVCLELAERGLVLGMQDLGAAGLTAAAVEAASRAGSGVELDVLLVPRREAGMNPYEVMLAESQERMLLILGPERLDEVREVLERWDLPYAVVGKVTGDGLARVREGERVVAEVPVGLLTDPPLYRYRVRKPADLKRRQSFDPRRLPDVEPGDCPEVLLRLLASPNVASKLWVFRQYDHQVQINTVIPPGEDAAVLRVKGTKKGLALTCDGNGRLCHLDPFIGAAMAVAEAARNLSCVGARPAALTDCLNLGDPERPEIYYQLKEVVRGMAYACRRLGVPVVSGNVSLYNETEGQAVYPTPVVGMLGLLDDIGRRCTMSFKSPGDVVYLLGGSGGGLGGSEYLELVHGVVAGRPFLDIDLEARVQECCREGIGRGLVRSAHDCSEGGLAAALAESVLASGLGSLGEEPEIAGRVDEFLFGEAPSRIVVSVPPGRAGELEELAARHGVPCRRLGRVGGDRFIFPGLLDLSLDRLRAAWGRGLENRLASSP